MAHVPAADTRTLGDLSFSAALEAASRPSPDYDAQKWLFVPNTYTEYRYLLGTRGARPLICVGVNPSTAAPERLDPTLQSVQRIALGNGYDSFVMLNVYAQRATAPGDMDARCHEALHRQNLAAFGYALSLSPRPDVWAAWGNLIGTKPYLAACLADMIEIAQRAGARWFHCGAISKKGHPHHPLYLRGDAPLEPFDARTYLELLTKGG